MKSRAALFVVIAVGAFVAGAIATWMLREPIARFAHNDSPVADPTVTSADSAESDAPTTWYTCGMHPEVIQDEPGTCPKCGMLLTPMDADRAAALGLSTSAPEAEAHEGRVVYWRSQVVPGELASEPGLDSTGSPLVPVYASEVGGSTIRIDPVTEQNMAVRIDQVTQGPLAKTVRTVGQVEFDETTLASINTKVAGWVEKLYVDETGAQLHRGDPLFEIYAPELVSAQQEYLAALTARSGAPEFDLPGAGLDATALARDARERLRHFDVSEEQIRELARTGKVRRTLTIRAPFTGVVTSKRIVEGERVEAGAELFRLADLSKVWVIAKVYESDLPFVEVGQEAFMTLSYLPNKTFRGRVTYIYPFLDEGTREIALRMEFHNPGYELKPGMFATVNLTSVLTENAVLVPDVAVIRTGIRTVAFVMREPGRYEARHIAVGARGDDNHLQVLRGLGPGEWVVVSGQFLLDSESRLREAALKLVAPGRVDASSPLGAPPPQPTDTLADGEGTLHWVCPMPEHVDILYDESGACPLCGMDLVPVRRHLGHVDPPVVEAWTCPMDEHAHVREPGPGACPLCGMDLVPVPPEGADAGMGGAHAH